MKSKLTLKVLCAIGVWIFCSNTVSPQSREKTSFWYSEAATDWRSATPIGNGRIGGMIFGDPDNEQVLINENTIWCGPPVPPNDPRGPELIKRMRQLLFDGNYAEADSICEHEFLDKKWAYTQSRTYQPFGFLHLKYDNAEPTSGYVRWLDYENAITYVVYEKDRVKYMREAFVSYPDQVMVIRLTADQPRKLTFTANFDRPFGATSKPIDDDKLYIKGQAHDKRNDFMGVKFDGIVQFSTQGGKVQSTDDGIRVMDANSVIIYVAINTDYNIKNPYQTLSYNRAKICRKQIINASRKGYEKLKADHIADFSELYNRSIFDVKFEEKSKTDIPIDRRITMAAKGTSDPDLLFVYYNYCRYLLISSSRVGGLALNLQGIWNPLMQPPWRSNFHININQQEAYWFVEQANLSECHDPFLVQTEKITKNGKETARIMLGAKRGSASGHRTDAWFYTAPTGHNPCHGMYVLGGAWCAQHMMEHYRFTMDKDFLKKRAYPVIRENAIFFLDWLVPHPVTGKLVSGPSASAENKYLINDRGYSITMGPSQDQELIWNVFRDYLEASRILGISNEETKEVENAMGKLAMPKIGSDGRLLEWPDEMVETELGHRHLSHLWGMMPGNRITQQETPYLVEAVKKSLDFRLANDYHAQGWSLGWVTCMLARLQEGDRCLDMMEHLYFLKAYPNMFVDAHGSVQVGDMMGIPLAMIELLLQSHTEYIDILPALPKDWKNGTVTGLCARGGFIIDMEWENRHLKSLLLRSLKGGKCKLRYKGKIKEMDTNPDKSYNISFE